MGKQLHRVVYKPDSQSTDEFIVIVDKTEVRRRRRRVPRFAHTPVVREVERR